MRVAGRVVPENDLLRLLGIRLPQMGLEPALPVAVAQRRRAGGEQQLARHEEIVRHRIGREVREVAEAERPRSEEHTSELQSQSNLVCRLLLEKIKLLTY